MKPGYLLSLVLVVLVISPIASAEYVNVNGLNVQVDRGSTSSSGTNVGVSTAGSTLDVNSNVGAVQVTQSTGGSQKTLDVNSNVGAVQVTQGTSGSQKTISASTSQGGTQTSVGVSTSPNGVSVGSSAGDVSVSTDKNRNQVNVVAGGSSISVSRNSAGVRASLQNSRIDVNNLGSSSVVEVRPNTIIVGDVRVQSAGKKLMVRTQGSDVEISSNGNEVIIKDGDIQVTASNLTVEKDKVKVNNIEIKTPGKALDAQTKAHAKKVEIKVENNKPVYFVSTEDNKRFLGIVSVKVNGDVTVDGSTGVVIRRSNPWWSFLAFG